MAVSRYARQGKRVRSSAQRAALKKAQLASARKRSRLKRVAVGGGAVLVAGGAAYSLRNTKAGKETKIAARRHFKTVKNIPGAPKRMKAKIKAFPYQKPGGDFAVVRKEFVKEHRKTLREVKQWRAKAELIARNKASAHTPEQRAAAKAHRSSYMEAYNRRRREAYRQQDSVGHGVRPRKKRAKETRPRKRKTD